MTETVVRLVPLGEQTRDHSAAASLSILNEFEALIHNDEVDTVAVIGFGDKGTLATNWVSKGTLASHLQMLGAVEMFRKELTDAVCMFVDPPSA